MATRALKLEHVSLNLSRQKQTGTFLCARDRLLAALEASPRLSRKDAEMINRVVQEAREESMADELSA
jgi:hypothetical protein